MNPSWSSWKPSLTSKVLETLHLWGFTENELNRYKGIIYIVNLSRLARAIGLSLQETYEAILELLEGIHGFQGSRNDSPMTFNS
jgi:hypothetical protein